MQCRSLHRLQEPGDAEVQALQNMTKDMQTASRRCEGRGGGGGGCKSNRSVVPESEGMMGNIGAPSVKLLLLLLLLLGISASGCSDGWIDPFSCLCLVDGGLEQAGDSTAHVVP